MRSQFEDLENSTRIYIENMFYFSKEMNHATERWKNFSTGEIGYSTPSVRIGRFIKTEEEFPWEKLGSLVEQQNALLHQVLIDFPNARNEILLWRLKPQVWYDGELFANEYNSNSRPQRIYLRTRFTSMPKEASIVRLDQSDFENKAA